MYENELTQAFCVPCFATMVLVGGVESRAWECPECGPNASDERLAAA